MVEWLRIKKKQKKKLCEEEANNSIRSIVSVFFSSLQSVRVVSLYFHYQSMIAFQSKCGQSLKLNLNHIESESFLYH